MKENKKEILVVLLIIVIQTIVYVIAGMNKEYIHMDEAYSFGLANYDKVEIQDNRDFYNTWHNKEYYEDYLVVNTNEIGQYKQVYENQKNDAHPPLYYLLLRFTMGFHLNSYSKWTGIILNIVIYAFLTIFMYLIVRKVFTRKDKSIKMAAVITLMASLTLASISNVIYIRMYTLSTLNIVMTTYLHLILLEGKSNKNKILICIGIIALAGSLTHYYYLFYLAMLFVMFVVKYIKEKRYRELISYIVTIGCAAIVSLIIFPYSIQHMFFGYRGQGVISNLSNIPKYAINIMLYLLKINIYTFNNILPFLIIAVIGIFLYKKRKKLKIREEKNPYITYLVFPTLFYFILAAVSSPWIELRYVMPICGMIYIVVLYFMVEIVSNLVKDKTINKIIIIIFITMIIMPLISNQILKKISFYDARIEPETMYSNKKEIVKELKEEYNVPTLYFLNSNYNRFLDDILLFSIINESYIAKDMKCEEQTIKSIFENKNIGKGIVIFINEGQDKNEIIKMITNFMNLKNVKHLKRLNACDVYYIY